MLIYYYLLASTFIINISVRDPIDSAKMNFSNFQEQDQIPPLIPLRKAKAHQIPVATPIQKNSDNEDMKNILLQAMKQTPTSQANVDKNQFPSKKQPNPEKIDEIEKKAKEKISTVQKKDNQLKKMENEKTKENQKSKFFIAQMLNTINVKNLSQQLYPVSNEAIQQLLTGIQKQISQLNIEADKKQRILAVNQNNLHLKKQLETIRRQVDHCCLIKQLYYEKMNYRNKIETLEGDIINLREEVKELKIRVARGVEALENYKQNLPSDNEKQLRDKLNRCTHELKEQRDMRQNLQKNVESIINNFKRLYDEADLARQIVAKKLKELEERERRLRKFKQEEHEQQSEEINSPARRVASLEVTDKQKPLHNSYSQYGNPNLGGNFSKRQQAEQDLKKSTNITKNSLGAGYPRQKDEKNKRAQTTTPAITLEEKIKKMRGNQHALGRLDK